MRLSNLSDEFSELATTVKELRSELEEIRSYRAKAINDSLPAPTSSTITPSFASVLQKTVSRTVLATSQLSGNPSPFQVLQHVDKESKRSCNVIIHGLPVSENDSQSVTELISTLGIKL